ncbi:MAG: peptide-binding protein [Candidatus Hydrogenedentes bacterium]|nr:peptide-binding protein [Candidatus Hydrogenedentota bacterium]
MKRRKIAYSTMVLLLLAVCCIVGCTPKTTVVSSADEAAPVRAKMDDVLTEYMPDVSPEAGDWLMLHLSVEMPHLNPLTSTDAYASELESWIFDTLIDRDPVTMENIPHAASSWEISEDHLKYTFHLRQDILFSDGEPLTADDVKFTYDMLMDPKVDAPHLRSYFNEVTACEVLDEYTVCFTCTKPYYRHLVMLGGLSIMPRHIYGEGDFNKHPNNRAPVGSGMYRLEMWETGQQITLSRNPHYWGMKEKGLPHFDKIVYAIITDDNTAFQVMSRGDIDFMGMPAETFVRRANTKKFKEKFNRFAYSRPVYTYIGWNSRKPMFADKTTRLALTMLLDRQLICDEIYYGQAQVISGNFMANTPEHNNAVTPVPFDPKEAVKLLTKAGWNSGSDGTLEREGVRFSFEVSTTIQNPVSEKVLTVYKEELARVGIELIIRPMEWASLLEQVDSRGFDATLMGWVMPPDPDPYQVWHSSQADAGSNHIGFINEESDRVIEEARVEFDRDKRIVLYHRFQEILHEEQPYLFLLAPKSLAAGDKRIHGIRVYPFGVEQRYWFVPRVQQRYGK